MKTLELNSEFNLLGQIDLNSVKMALDRDEMEEIVGGYSGGGGAAVMGCITDAYSNHGWVSVWLTVQSAFIPATAAGIALGCYAKN